MEFCYVFQDIQLAVWLKNNFQQDMSAIAYQHVFDFLKIGNFFVLYVAQMCH